MLVGLGVTQFRGATVDWFFDGLGTLVIGLIVGGGAGAAAGWRVVVTRTRQQQRAGNSARQTQIGRDFKA
jgi:hypothetical protein